MVSYAECGLCRVSQRPWSNGFIEGEKYREYVERESEWYKDRDRETMYSM